MAKNKKNQMASEAKFRFVCNEIKRYSVKLSSLIDEDDKCVLQTVKLKIINLEHDLKESFLELSQDDDESYDKFVEMDDSIINLLGKIENALKSFESSDVVKSDKNNANSLVSLNLPKFDLPTFDGDINNWLSFKEIFRTSIHEKKELSSLQKLQYLQSAVKGDALKLIKGFSLIEDNYVHAWETLISRFDNKRELAFAQLSKLFGLKALKSITAKCLHEMLDTCNEALRNLYTLGFEQNKMVDIILIHSLENKLDDSIRRQWELSLEGHDIPTYKQFIDFLEKQARSLQGLKDLTVPGKPETKPKFFPRKSIVNNAVVKSENHICVLCQQAHPFHKCQQFGKMSLDQRWNIVKTHKLCINCLRSNHFSSKCLITTRCKSCNEKHHTLLHAFKPQSATVSFAQSVANSSNIPDVNVDFNQDNSTQRNAQCFASSVNENSQTLLSTAEIRVKNATGQFIICRALVDNGSQKSLISKDCCKKLKLPIKQTNHRISGINDTVAETSLHEVKLTFTPHFCQDTFQSDALVVNKVTTDLPNFSLPKSNWSHLKNLTLADPNFSVPGPVDILIGADLFAEIIIGNPVMGMKGSPTAIKSKLGWLLSGRIFSTTEHVNSVLSCHALTKLDVELKKFWEIESVPLSLSLSNEDQICEDFYKSTVTRNESGRYIVKLPFKSETDLGESKSQALKRFHFLETKLNKNPNLKSQYTSFMQEYRDLNHMESVPPDELHLENSNHFYLPHHGVFKEDSTTTKLRVVFDASAKSSNGHSLNDILHVGPKLQPELFKILLKFRTFSVALSSDIEKMYRQILVSPDDTNFQRILWRFHPDEPITSYKLLTVTYGTASAPYLAIRTLHQLALDEMQRFPEAAKVILQDSYVDDLLTGSDSISEAKRLVAELNEIMNRGGFNLRKWSSNEAEVLTDLQEDKKSYANSVNIKEDHSIKVLGIHWNPRQDTLQIQIMEQEQVLTKRQLLSVIARIFDPLGFLSPTTILLKIMMQDLWKDKLSWDEIIPDKILNTWNEFSSQLNDLKKIQIPRHMKTSGSEVISVQLHGFCDASTKAYAAVFYTRVILSTNEVLVSFVTAKTKVAPVKPVTVPRLELCAAVLLARLCKSITDSLQIEFSDIFLWSDSQIVLSWIASKQIKGNPFVMNRVAQIQSLTSLGSWNHIPGATNPADAASRGIMPQKLLYHKLWWKGPFWLSEEILQIPSTVEIQESKEAETSLVDVLSHTSQVKLAPDFIYKYSSFSKLTRVVAFCLRFINNSRRPEEKYSGSLKASELSKSIHCIVKLIQEQEFSNEIKLLKQNKPLQRNSKLLQLNVFLDQSGVLRVGGRLSKNQFLNQDQKHPMLIPKGNEVTKSIIRQYHLRYLHAGPQLLLSLLRQKFWFISGRATVRQEVNNCLICFKLKAKTCQQIMGDLPADRITLVRAFQKSGLDFAGPFVTKSNLKRSKVTFKSYICLFICMCTKAVHLELVSDLSTQALLAALRRFIGRRGLPTDLYSDNGTNFKGASNYLKQLFKLVQDQEIQNYAAEQMISWHFIPPNAPNFGGLWEASIKLTKSHLTKICKSSLLNFEEMSTLLCQIEACVNSRPLTPLSSDPSDLRPLTPGHFLVGAPLAEIPEPTKDIGHLKLTTRWQRIQDLRLQFWTRWSRDYLHHLQQRPKWNAVKPDVQVGDLVFLHDNRTPPLQWTLGRITQTFPGSDNHTRVVSVKTSSGTFTRPVSRLSPLLPRREDVQS